MNFGALSLCWNQKDKTMITEKDFQKKIENHVDSEEKITGTKEAGSACYELAKQMAIDFSNWAHKHRNDYDYRIPTHQLFSEYINSL